MSKAQDPSRNPKAKTLAESYARRKPRNENGVLFGVEARP
jgi:hypothetical protein